MLSQDESPFIYLTMDPKNIDILCVNCYECLNLDEVDLHSRECTKKPENLVEDDDADFS